MDRHDSRQLCLRRIHIDHLQHAQRGPQGRLHVPIVNPADKYQDKAEAMHQYGQYLLSALPKWIQQYAQGFPKE